MFLSSLFQELHACKRSSFNFYNHFPSFPFVNFNASIQLFPFLNPFHCILHSYLVLVQCHRLISILFTWTPLYLLCPYFEVLMTACRDRLNLTSSNCHYLPFFFFFKVFISLFCLALIMKNPLDWGQSKHFLFIATPDN